MAKETNSTKRPNFAGKEVRENMKITFEGQTHSIDANTLINVLSYYQVIISEANRIYGDGAKDIDVKVNAPVRGSFVVDISLVQTIVEQLFNRSSVEYLAGLSAVIGGAYKLYRHFYGRPIKTEEDKQQARTIINVKGDLVVKTTNVYNLRITREAISKTIETADADTSVEGLTLSESGDDRGVTFSKDDFKKYIYDDFDTEEDTPDERNVDVDAILIILSLNFEPGGRWAFMYEGFKISVIVKDSAIAKHIDEGARFGKGDAIRVKLRKIQQYNKRYKTFENKGYKILEFYKHIPAPKQTEIDFSEDV